MLSCTALGCMLVKVDGHTANTLGNSHHHPRVFTGIIRCMQNRASQVCDATSKQAEMDHLEEVFQPNRFPE